jgi:sodium/hydrogen antiporter
VHVDRYELALAVVGLVALLAAWAPAHLARRPVSLPVLLVAGGAVAFLFPSPLPDPDPRQHLELAERLTEIGVIVTLMGAGLKLDRPMGLRRWGTTWRMLAIAMPLTIAAVAVVGVALAGLALASAVLLGAALAPTDPVLAAEVQVGEPTIAAEDDTTPMGTAGPPGPTDREGASGEPVDDAEDDVRFTLTSEGGLNDALAFPFVYLAIRLRSEGTGDGLAWMWSWLAVDVGYRLAAGVLAGYLIGRLLAVVAFRPPGPFMALAETPQGFMAIAATLLAYGATELVHGYGFLAVFVTAVTLRSAERRHALHGHLHAFTEQAENLLVVGLLLVLGGSIAAGLLDALSWQGFLVALLLVMVLRPAVGMLALVGSPASRPERWAIAFFGIRGIGSVYYLSYAVSEHRFDDADQLWSIVAATILLSVLVHGVTATPAMAQLDRIRTRRSARRRRRRSRIPG